MEPANGIDDARDSHRIRQPSLHKAKPVIWADLTVNDVDIILSTDDPNEIRYYLARIFGLEDDSNLKNIILLDLYFYTISFCKESNFNKEQMSALFSIVNATHQVAIETPFGNVDETFTYFKDLVLCHSVHRPPFSLGLFAAEQVSSILKYVIDTYFRHFKLYKFVFTPEVRLDLSITYSGIPMTPPPEVEENVAEEMAPVESSRPQTTTEEQKSERAEGENSEVEKAEEVEESEAMKQLREMVRSHLSKELKEMKSSIELSLKTSEDTISQKILNAETGKKATPRGSAKGKGKK